MDSSMKSAALTFAAMAFATFAFTAPANAADIVTIETLVRHSDEVIAAPRVAIVSGKTATIRSGALELSIHPTAMQDGTVVIASRITTDADTPKPVCVAQPKVVVAVGRTATVKVGDWEVSFTPVVAK